MCTYYYEFTYSVPTSGPTYECKYEYTPRGGERAGVGGRAGRGGPTLTTTLTLNPNPNPNLKTLTLTLTLNLALTLTLNPNPNLKP